MEAGEAEARTLSEVLAIDFATLLAATFPKADVKSMQALKDEGVTRRMQLGGQLLWAAYGVRGIAKAAKHRSDTVRGWACYAIAAIENLDVVERLRRVQDLADDHNAGVREWAWLAVRPAITADLAAALGELAVWARSERVGVRRFASEATRPRGVWCAHLNELKARPELGLPILEPLRADEAEYVRLSVANWLNDASKSQPDWVRSLARRWRKESPLSTTEKIVKRALRTLEKS
jgi:3-methyladenine DNA glycosylase AlkC